SNRLNLQSVIIWHTCSKIEVYPMAVNVLEETSVDFISYVPTEANIEAKKLLKLYWTLDNWLDHIDLFELQKMHAQVLRLQLTQLVQYYFERGERNKAKLAGLLIDAAIRGEKMGLTQAQVETIQAQLIYFQRVELTMDDLSACDRNLWAQGMYPMYEMPDWEKAVLDH
ncbi:MAG: hypothetical protein AAF639_41965, partial [Chloroflexota bacterium]